MSGQTPTPCPGCAFPRSSGPRTCPACGYDPVAGVPRAVSVVPLRALSSRRDAVPAADAGGRWAVEIAPDRAYFDRGEDDAAAAFPIDALPRAVRLDGERAVIGRRSRSRGHHPELDLSLPPRDPGVSRSHAVLERRADGSVAVTDLGSANGTWVGPDATRLVRLSPGAAGVLAAGDHVFVGSWTRVTVRTRHAPTP